MQLHVFEGYSIPNKGGPFFKTVLETIAKRHFENGRQQIETGSLIGTTNVECGKLIWILVAPIAAMYSTDTPLLSHIVQLLLEDSEEIQGHL